MSHRFSLILHWKCWYIVNHDAFFRKSFLSLKSQRQWANKNPWIKKIAISDTLIISPPLWRHRFFWKTLFSLQIWSAISRVFCKVYDKTQHISKNKGTIPLNVSSSVVYEFCCEHCKKMLHPRQADTIKHASPNTLRVNQEHLPHLNNFKILMCTNRTEMQEHSSSNNSGEKKNQLKNFCSSEELFSFLFQIALVLSSVTFVLNVSFAWWSVMATLKRSKNKGVTSHVSYLFLKILSDKVFLQRFNQKPLGGPTLSLLCLFTSGWPAFERFVVTWKSQTQWYI